MKYSAISDWRYMYYNYASSTCLLTCCLDSRVVFPFCTQISEVRTDLLKVRRDTGIHLEIRVRQNEQWKKRNDRTSGYFNPIQLIYTKYFCLEMGPWFYFKGLRYNKGNNSANIKHFDFWTHSHKDVGHWEPEVSAESRPKQMETDLASGSVITASVTSRCASTSFKIAGKILVRF